MFGRNQTAEAISLIMRALDFAARAHAEHKRKYTDEPYINHPIGVALIVAGVDPDPEVIAAALLHDVVEMGTPPVVIHNIFGDRVFFLVDSVTSVSKPEDGNRAQRKAKDREHYAKASAKAQTIKLADIIHNCSSIVIRDPGGI